jgi:glycosyltransferase involved in cell wall biosynthesis
MYSFFRRIILRFLTKRNAKKAGKIIVPSECTKQDLIRLYGVNPDKIFVVPHGVENQNEKIESQNDNLKFKDYILYLGSDQRRKNIDGIIEAFEILKEKYKIPHKLVLAGMKQDGKWQDIIFMSYVDKNKKWELLKKAEIFVFPSFYEGFGLPVLEAQKAGIPVVASNTGALPEILGNSALLVNPNNSEEIAEAIYKVLSNEQLRNDLIKRGQENIRRFSWLKCAEETLKIITL